MRSLLYATDYSDNSIPALKFAWNLSQKLDVPLYVIHVFDINATFISTVSIAYARMEEAAFLKNADMLREFCKENIGVEPDQKKLTTVVAENTLASVSILEKAEEFGAGMILAGKTGSSLIRDLFIGSTATGLIEKSHIPVMLLPGDYQNGSIETIVYATAFEQADIFAIRDITHWASLFGAEIKIFHVSTKDEYAGEDQMEWFKDLLAQKVNYPKVTFELQFADDVYTALSDYIKEVKADLLAMLEREEHNMLTGIWHRDLVKKMKGQSNLPLLSIPKNKEHATGFA